MCVQRACFLIWYQNRIYEQSMYVSMYVLFCHVLYGCFVYILYAYICMHLCICILAYIYIYIYIYVCSSVYVYACLYVGAGTDFCLYKSYLLNCLFCRYLGCYLSVCHCYLGSILSFSFEFLNLNTTTCTKSST